MCDLTMLFYVILNVARAHRAVPCGVGGPVIVGVTGGALLHCSDVIRRSSM